MTKRQKLENRYYKLTKSRKYQEADKLMKKIVQLDVQRIKEV